MDRRERGRLLELASLFLKLGTIGFGGPAAHIAMMEDEVVRRRRWLERERFLDLVGAVNLIPGPNSTELAIHIGHLRGGWAGLAVAGVCFILPAFLIVLGCAWAYVRFGALPAAEAVLYGVKPVVIAVVLQALVGLGRTAVRTRPLAAVGLAALAAVAFAVHELLVLLAAGVVLAVHHLASAGRGPASSAGAAAAIAAGSAPGSGPPALASAGPAAKGPAAALPLAAALAPASLPIAAASFGLLPLFLFFLKVGAVLFGSGYVLLAFLRADLVERYGWLTEVQLLDAVAVGQVTPGPVFTTATFVGYVLGGSPGALVATLGIFLPAFVFVALSGPLVPRIRRSPVAGAFLDGVNVASLALMAAVTAALARAAIVDVTTLLAALAAVVLLMRYRVNSSWLVLAGALLGLSLRG
jgi:chromate transporter